MDNSKLSPLGNQRRFIAAIANSSILKRAHYILFKGLRAGRAYPVWTVTSREVPGLLVLRGEVHRVRIYAVDREVPEEVLYG